MNLASCRTLGGSAASETGTLLVPEIYCEDTLITAIPHNQPARKRRTPLLQRRPVVAILSVAACIAFTMAGMNAAYPFVRASHMRAQNDELERELRRTEIQNQEDLKKLKALQTRQGLILAARRRGYVFPNEHKLRVPDVPK